MITHAEYFGGAEVTSLAGGSEHKLHIKRFSRLDGTGSGTGTVRLPYSKGLKAGHHYYVRWTTSAGVDMDVENFSGTTQTIYDKLGDARTLLDVSNTTQWGTDPCILCTLKDGTTADGVWDVTYIGDGT